MDTFIFSHFFLVLNIFSTRVWFMILYIPLKFQRNREGDFGKNRIFVFPFLCSYRKLRAVEKIENTSLEMVNVYLHSKSDPQD